MKSHHKHLFTITLFIIGIGLVVFFFRANLYRASIPVITDYATSNIDLPINAVITTPTGFQIYARVANTAATQQLGLSYIPSLPDNQGMIFTFSQPAVQKFWMKGMAFPLDIIWLKKISNGKYQVIYIAPNLAPDTYPQTFGPDQNADAVLEINANDAAKFGIVTGKTLTVDISN